MKPETGAPGPQLLELPGRLLGEKGRIRLMEAGHPNPWWIYTRILSGIYDKPFIIEDGKTRRLHFGLGAIQSSMRIREPDALDFAYTRKMMAFLLFRPDPAHILMVGLGGGSLLKFCHRHLPRTRLTVVEVNPDVIALRGEFNIPDDARVRIVQADAAEYLPGAEGDTDILLLDGFDARGIAPGFEHSAFYRAARRRLATGGVLVANFAGTPEGWSRHLELLREAFSDQVLVARVTAGDNHVAFAFSDGELSLDWTRLEARSAELARRIPLDFRAILKRLAHGAGQQHHALAPSRRAPQS